MIKAIKSLILMSVLCNFIETMEKILKATTMIIFLVIFLGALGFVRNSFAVYSIPSDRKITWSAGLDPVGGIPTNYTEVTCNGLHNNNSVDDTAAIQACIDNASSNTAIVIPAGVYKINGTITMKSNVILRGAKASGWPFLPTDDATATTLNMNGGRIDFNGGSKDNNWYPARPNGTAISSGYTQASTSITVSSSSGYATNDFISIYQDEDSAIIDDKNCTWLGEDYGSGDPHVMQQYSQITAINGNVLTIDPAIFYVTPNATNPKIRKQTFNVVKAGLENLRLNGNGANYKFVLFRFTKNCWMKGVETYNVGYVSSGSPHVWTDFSYENEYRDSYLHHGISNDSGGNYGFEFYNWNSRHKVENNIIRDTRHSIAFEGGGSGNAILYNYTDDNGESIQGQGNTYDTSFLGEDAIINHGSHPYMNLWEGNSVTSYWSDYTQGSASHNTLFRNHVRGNNTTLTLDSNPWLWVCVEIEQYNRYVNLVGNVIGNSSFTTGTVVCNSSNCGATKPYIYRFGYSSSGGSYSDSASYSTAILQGNYDYVTDGVAAWADSDHTLANSLYYNSQPSWWTNGIPWPPIGPYVTGQVNDIPAKVRYTTPRPSAPTGLRIIQ